VTEKALQRQPYRYDPATIKRADPNKRRRWLIPLVLAAQIAFKVRAATIRVWSMGKGLRPFSHAQHRRPAHTDSPLRLAFRGALRAGNGAWYGF
jgi:hypothetical protein